MTTTLQARPAEMLPATASGQRRLRLRRTLTSYLFLSPALILMIGLMFIPIGTVLYYSFVNYAIVNRPGRTPHLVGLANYTQVFSDPNFVASIWHTVLFSVASVALHLLLGLGFALLLNSDAVGRATKGVFRTLIILPWLFTITIVVALWRY